MDWTLVSYTYVANVQLGLHVGSPTIGVVAISGLNSVACIWKLFPLAGLPCLASVGEDALIPDET